MQKIILYHRLTKAKSPKSKKSAKEMHKEALNEIIKSYKNPKSKLKFKRVKDGKPSICQRCKKCPKFCKS